MTFKKENRWMYAGDELINLDNVIRFHSLTSESNQGIVLAIEVFFIGGSILRVDFPEYVELLQEELHELAMGFEYDNDDGSHY